MKLLEKTKALLTRYIEENIKAIYISGKSGLGKSETIKSVCINNSQSYIWVDYNFSLFDSPFKEVLKSKIKGALLQYNYDLSFIESNYNIVESIFKMINLVNNNQKIILTFENIQNAQELDVLFICEILKYSRLLSNICIIIDEDTDCNKMFNYNYIKSCIVFKSINFKKYDVKDIKWYICYQYGCSSIKISDTDMNHIYIACEGTLSITNVIINELEQLDLINYDTDTIVVKSLPHNFLLNGIKPYIIKRYEKLTREYRIILAKTSCIGFDFTCEDLFGIFSIPKIYDILNNIQEASHLIYEIEKEEYCFESVEVYNLINEKVDQYINKNEITKTIAEYYKNSLTNDLKNKNYTKYIKNLSLAKDLYEKISDLTNLSKCYQLLIGCKIKSDLFSEALILCKHYDKICLDEIQKIINYTNMLKCYIELEDYYNGKEICSILLKKDTSMKFYYIYNLALCEYGLSDGKQALYDLNSIVNEINKKTSPLLYAQTVRLLSSIYDFYNEWENQLKYFTDAISFCRKNNIENEYYSILRQSGMVYPYEVSLAMYKTAESYFRKNKNYKELAKVKHNIATDSMYMLDLQLAKNECKQSIELFKYTGNTNICNPINLMGILLCLINKDYNKALDCFNTSLLIQNDKWTKCVVSLNISTVYRKIGNNEKSLSLINEVKELNNETMPIISITTGICELLYYFEASRYSDCNKIINYLLVQKKLLEYRHIYLINKILYKLNLKSIELKDNNSINTNYINSTCSKYLDRCFENCCYWATTRFWEN